MRGRARTGTGDRLERIAALLLALADLAERAAGRCLAVRFLVLWSLFYADAVARDFVAEIAEHATGRKWSPVLPEVRHGSDAAAAFALAASLRSLARVVRSMIARSRRRQLLSVVAGRDRGDQGILDPLDKVIRLLRDAVFPPLRPLDSS